MSALKNYRNTPAVVTTPISSTQVKNNTGGYVFEVSNKSRLERFLILGVDGGTYYVSEQELTKQNVDWLIKLIQSDPHLVLETVLEVSEAGRSYRNSAAIFTLALMLNHAPENYRQNVASVAHKVARTGTMVFELAQYIENLGGWGRAKRSAIAKWFTSKTPDQLAYQAVKYRQRNGWTLKDLMRLSHPVGVHQGVGGFILKGETDWADIDILSGYHYMSKATSLSGPEGVIALLKAYPSLPWETIPTQFLKDPEVWKTLFYNNNLNGQALLRNIVRLSRNGAFSDIQFAGDYAKKLTDIEMIRKTRLHPVQYLLASVVYSDGQIDRNAVSYWSSSRNKDWTTNPKISSALMAGFGKSFATVTPSNKRFRIGVDVSGSMSVNSAIGSDFTAAQGAAAMALMTAKVEDYVEILGFASSLTNLDIHSEMSWSEVNKKVQMHNFGSTNPSLLINDAANKNVAVDTFLVITDNEANSGSHPAQALRAYRQKMGIDSKLVVMGMTSTGFTIADPNDRGMLDVVGFDSNAPKVVSDFSAGRI